MDGMSFEDWQTEKQQAAGKTVDDSTNKVYNTLNDTIDFDGLKQYLGDKGITVNDSVSALDFKSVKESMNGVMYVYDEFPQARQMFKNIDSGAAGVMSASYHGDIKLNTKMYATREKCLQSHPQSTYHPKGNSPFSSGAHEAGHLLERALIDKHNGNIIDWRDCTQAKRVVSEAWKEAKKYPESKGVNMYKGIERISRYANTDRSECLAEAVADYSVNKEYAAPLSKEIWKILKMELG